MDTSPTIESMSFFTFSSMILLFDHMFWASTVAARIPSQRLSSGRMEKGSSSCTANSSIPNKKMARSAIAGNNANVVHAERQKQKVCREETSGVARVDERHGRAEDALARLGSIADEDDRLVHLHAALLINREAIHHVRELIQCAQRTLLSPGLEALLEGSEQRAKQLDLPRPASLCVLHLNKTPSTRRIGAKCFENVRQSCPKLCVPRASGRKMCWCGTQARGPRLKRRARTGVLAGAGAASLERSRRHIA
eukprot:scaffold120307_cov31-Tisochrysis_lutea.AAC.2